MPNHCTCYRWSNDSSNALEQQHQTERIGKLLQTQKIDQNYRCQTDVYTYRNIKMKSD